MDDPNIIMEEYIQLMADNARGRDQTFNWETATYGEDWCDNMVSNPHGFIIHWIEIFENHEKVTKVVDIENWRIDNSQVLRWVVSLIERNSPVSSTKSSIHSTFRFRKLKRAKDYTHHKEKMLLCKQAKKGVSLKVEQAEDTDEEIDGEELKAHYSFMAKIQEVLPAKSGYDVEPLEKDDSNVILDSSNMCDNDNQSDQNVKERDDERVVLANLIVNLKLDTDENKKIQKQLNKANTSLSHELRECKSALEECKSSLGESNKT
ncbi:hypothetical protein Tco_1217729 [Tanacetum coccineum]